MIDPDALNVWFDDRLVGYLWRNPVGGIGFRYEPALSCLWNVPHQTIEVTVRSQIKNWPN